MLTRNDFLKKMSIGHIRSCPFLPQRSRDRFRAEESRAPHSRSLNPRPISPRLDPAGMIRGRQVKCAAVVGGGGDRIGGDVL